MILADYQVNGQFPSSVATSGTAAVYFPRTLGTNGPGSTPATPTATNAAGQLIVPGSAYASAVVGQKLKVVAAGTWTTFASYAVTVTVQLNTGTVASPAYTTLMTTGAVTTGAAAVASPWFLEADIVIGSAAASPTAPNITGFYDGAWTSNTTPTLIDLTAITAPTNAVVMGASANPNPAGLVVNITFGTGHAGNAATLNEFAIFGD